MKKVFIGLAKIIPQSGNNDLEGKDYAIVNVICQAISEEDFESIVNTNINDYGYDLDKLDSIEVFNDNYSYFNGDNLIDLKNEAIETGEIKLGTLYTYNNTDTLKNWISIVNIRSLKEGTKFEKEGSIGAWVKVAYKAWDKENLIALINNTFEEEGYEVIEVDDISSIDYTNSVNDNEEFLELLNDITEKDYSYSWGIFYTYDNE